MRRSVTIVVAVVVTMLSGALAAVAFGNFGDWGEAVDIESFGAGADEDFNTASLEGCPFVSPDGKMFFIASNRPGGLGGLDIWVATRASDKVPWSEPVNLGAPINSAANDFCPTIARNGKTFFFASNRTGYCGSSPNADLYTTRLDAGLQAGAVTHLGCEVNSAWDEHSPFPAEMPVDGPVLFYSSARPADSNDSPGDHDLYYSPMHGGVYGAGLALSSINTTANEGQPNVRRDGQELFFWSDRPGGIGGQDIYSAAQLSITGSWGSPQNLGSNVNSAAGETRPSLSWDGTTLYFGSTRVGAQSDIYVTTR
jgi:Tol biopolymer transport system component